MGQWVIDPDHSVAAFAIRHMTIAYVRGQFNKISGTLHFDPADMGALKARAEIDVSSLWTGIKKRDEHLLSADFFDAGKYPKMTFETTKALALAPGRLRLSGDLSIRGVTRPVTLDVEYSGPVKAPMGEETSFGFTATTTLNPVDFGITWNVPMPEGVGFVVGSEARLTLDVECDLIE
jgi:polyisoprenoid-binding protein YceI